jgi:glycosyltransferase involved in cell wall biosynthesis
LLYNDYGHLFLDRLLLKIHPNAILDFDDDISAAKNQPKKITSVYGKLLKEDGDKFNNSLKLYSNFIVASNYLKTRVESTHEKQPNINIIPTCVDYTNFPEKKYNTKKPFVFGWIGGNHNYFLLDNLLPLFDELSRTYSFKLLVIGGDEYRKNVNFEIEFRKWSLETEINNLLDIDIGLMPLINDTESKGKGGFKLIQYMGLGIVSIASPITINKEIVDHQKNSFLAKDNEEWKYWLTQLLEGKVDLQKMGEEARIKINATYTFSANKNKYINFIDYVRNSRLLEK